MFPCSFIKQDHGINATMLQTHWTVTSSVAACSQCWLIIRVNVIGCCSDWQWDAAFKCLVTQGLISFSTLSSLFLNWRNNNVFVFISELFKRIWIRLWKPVIKNTCYKGLKSSWDIEGDKTSWVKSWFRLALKAEFSCFDWGFLSSNQYFKLMSKSVENGCNCSAKFKKKELKKKAVPEAGHLCVNFGDISD